MAVVRDPWARAYSSWVHLRKVANDSEHNSDRFFGTWLFEFDSFAAFVEAGGLAVAAKMCPHFFPALDYVADPATGDVLVDEIHRFEALHDAHHAGDGLSRLLVATGLDAVARRKNVSARFTDSPRGRQLAKKSLPDKHCPHYTQRAADIVAAVYADDAEAFGYAFDCPMSQLALYSTTTKASLQLKGSDKVASDARKKAAQAILARTRPAPNATTTVVPEDAVQSSGIPRLASLVMRGTVRI